MGAPAAALAVVEDDVAILKIWRRVRGLPVASCDCVCGGVGGVGVVVLL